MRKFNKLNIKDKFNKVLWAVIDFIYYKIWGKYHGGLRSIWYYIRTHTYNRYHIINIKGQGDYKWGWLDADYKMHLACFKILCDFVEQENPKVGLNTLADYQYEGQPEDHDEFVQRQLDDDAEIRAIYNWWKYERKREHDEVSALLDDPEGKYSGMEEYDFNEEAGTVKIHFKVSEHPNWEEWRRRNKEAEEKDANMLLRLMAIRGRLWT